MDESFVRKRIAEICVSKGLSEYKMSKELGHSKNYIHNITSGQTMPSISELLYICDFYNIEPKYFFDDGITNPVLIQSALNALKNKTDQDISAIIYLINRLPEK